MKVTMSDIAAKLGVSNSTVSLALNNSPKVSAAMREKVMATAKEMGYHTNPYVSALMAARRHGKNPTHTPVIALITATEHEDDWKKGYHLKRFVQGCSATAENQGTRPELFWIGDESMTARRLNEILINRGIHGAALMLQGKWSNKLDHAWNDIATVTYGARRLNPLTDSVSADFYGNMEKTLGILIDQKLKRIGFVMDRPFPYKHDNRWLAAYLMKQYQGRINKISPWLDAEPSFDGFKRWFEASKPDAIICVHPPTVIEWLRRMGLKVPGDLGVVAIGTAERNGEVSGIVENTRTCGKLAMEMLMERIHRGEFGNYTEPHAVTVSGQWNRGETLHYLS